MTWFIALMVGVYAACLILGALLSETGEAKKEDVKPGWFGDWGGGE